MVCVCVCYMLMSTCIHKYAYMETKIGSWVSFSTAFFGLNERPRGAGVLLCPLSQCWDLVTCSHAWVFIWLIGIQAQVLMFVQSKFLLPEHLFSRTVKSYYLFLLSNPLLKKSFLIFTPWVILFFFLFYQFCCLPFIIFSFACVKNPHHLNPLYILVRSLHLIFLYKIFVVIYLVMNSLYPFHFMKLRINLEQWKLTARAHKAIFSVIFPV